MPTYARYRIECGKSVAKYRRRCIMQVSYLAADPSVAPFAPRLRPSQAAMAGSIC